MLIRVPFRRRLRRWQRNCATFGNLCFFIGSLLFFSERSETAGVWLFVAGSFGLLLSSFLPAVLRRLERWNPKRLGRPTSKR